MKIWAMKDKSQKGVFDRVKRQVDIFQCFDSGGVNKGKKQLSSITEGTTSENSIFFKDVVYSKNSERLMLPNIELLKPNPISQFVIAVEETSAQFSNR